MASNVANQNRKLRVGLYIIGVTDYTALNVVFLNQLKGCALETATGQVL